MHLVGFITKKFVTTHGHINVKELVTIHFTSCSADLTVCNWTNNIFLLWHSQLFRDISVYLISSYYYLFIFLFDVRTYLYTLWLNIHQKDKTARPQPNSTRDISRILGIKLGTHTEGIQSPLTLPHIPNTRQTHSIYFPLLSLSSEIITF